MNTDTNTSVTSLKIVGNTFPKFSAGRIAINRAADRLEQLERELADLREQVAILRGDQNRLSEFTKTYRLRADEAEDQLAAVTAAIHKIHPTRRGSLVDMAEDLESYRETAMNAFRLSEKELAAERALADRLAGELKAASGYINFETEYFEDESALTAWKEARSETP
jgi:chromosome segregation ATPase